MNVRLSRGCWVSADQAADLLARCTALLGVAPADTVVVGRTAAQLHGFWLPAGSVKPELATRTPGSPPSRMTRPRRPELVTARRAIPDDHLVLIDGIPVTSPARTWVDLAANLSLPDLVAAGDSALRGGVTREELAAVLIVSARHRGIRAARTAFDLLDERSRSRPESHLRVAVTAPDLPAFEVNVAVRNRVGEWLAEPDLSCAEARLALEYQGEEHSQPDRMRRDITRFGDLRRAGWLVIPYGPAEIFRRPWQIAPEIRAHVRDRAPHLLRPTRPARSARFTASSGQ